jgi:hypothetical protein
MCELPLAESAGDSSNGSFAVSDPASFWIELRPQGDSNPCYSLERAVSWAGLDDGD